MTPLIRPLANSDLAAFMTYLADHLTDNGRNGVPLFMPQSRDSAWVTAEKLSLFRDGLTTPVGDAGWRRPWAAFDPASAIIGHVDLRAHPEPCTPHRALLGMGVHRDHRRLGLGRALGEVAIDWARRETTLAWIDLDFLAGNLPAERLYLSLGFQTTATVPDMFRVDGQSVGNVIMTKRLGSADLP